MNIELVHLKSEDREQFILDNQEAFKYGAMEEFGLRDDHFEEEKLKEDETRKFLENAFREGEVKTVGTDIDKLMPPVSRFGGGNRANKKKNVINRLKAYFDKFYGVGGNANFLSTNEKK